MVTSRITCEAVSDENCHAMPWLRDSECLDAVGQKLAAAGFDPVETSTRDFLLPNTPPVLVNPVVRLGGWLERVPGLNRLAQSVFVVATRPPSSPACPPRR